MKYIYILIVNIQILNSKVKVLEYLENNYVVKAKMILFHSKPDFFLSGSSTDFSYRNVSLEVLF